MEKQKAAPWRPTLDFHISKRAALMCAADNTRCGVQLRFPYPKAYGENFLRSSHFDFTPGIPVMPPAKATIKRKHPLECQRVPTGSMF